MKERKKNRYTCAEYREERRLLGLQKRLTQDGLTDSEKTAIREEVQRIEALLGMD